MNTARVLSKAEKPLTQEEIEKFIVSVFSACYELHVLLYGFDYEEGVGIYTIGPREELEKMKNTNIEDFDFETFVKTTDKELIWLADWSDPFNPILNRMYKNK